MLKIIDSEKKKDKKYLGLFLLLLIFGSFLFYFISQSFYLDNLGNLKTFSWTLNSDWMMHMAQVHAFKKINFLDVVTNNPIYSGEVLAYPFFVNWVSGFLLHGTNNLVFSMLFPVYIGTLLFLSGIYFLTYQLTKNVFVSFITPIVFFFLAGFQAYFTLQEYDLFSDAWKNLKDYEYDIHFLGKVLLDMGYVFNWKSFFLTTFIPQRSFIWGMAMGTFMLGFFVKQQSLQTIKSGTNISRNFFRENFIYFIIGLGVGCLSFIHTHTFFYFFFFFLLLFIFSSIQIFMQIYLDKNIKLNKKLFKNFKNYFFLGVGACIASLPFLYLLFQQTGEVSQFSLFPFGKNVNIFEYLLLNWGMIFILGLILLNYCYLKNILNKITLNKTNISTNLLLYNFLLASAFLLILFSVWQLQSNPWDNTKVLLWSGLFFSMSASIIFVYIWNFWGIFGKMYSIILFIFSVLSGVIMFWSGVDDAHYQIFSAKEIEDSKKIESFIKPDALILTSDYFHHFISALLSNPIFMGYRGWIASYGMDWDSKIEIAKIIYSGGEYSGIYKNLEYRDVLKIIKDEKIQYIFVDNSASTEYGVSLNYYFFNRYFREVVNLKNRGILYEMIEE